VSPIQGPARDEGPDPTVEQVSRLLSGGTLLVLGLVVLGSGLMIATGRGPLAEPGPALDPGRLVADLVALRPEGVLWLGLLLGLCLPTARTAVACLGFARQGDRRAALVAAGVLTVLAASAVVALLTS
jgi:hypothetical protein